ncbi:velvet factor-domain-containing protein [Flammula alnicola]|nr:velvet factor-domain-containing protein [Flammula alnicola]
MMMSIDWERPLSVTPCLPCKNECIHESYESRRQPVSLRCPLMLSNKARRVCGCPHELNKKPFIQRCFIKKCNHCYHVPTMGMVPLSLCRRSKKDSCARTQRIKYSYLRFHVSSLYLSLSSTSSSSGQSSPQSSFSSLTFSSRTSSSTRSPPSSQSSIADLSTSPPLPFIRSQPRIQVSSLLADPHTRSYHLEIVQHPLRTAEFGSAYLSRVPLTPPIIAQLTVRDPSGNAIVPEAELPFLVAHLSLFSGDGLTPLDMGSFIGRGVMENPPTLYGHLVSTVEQLEDLQGNMGLFFLFPDVSIRSRGRYQLGVTLTRITSPDPSGLAEHGTGLAQTRTRPFDAVALHEYTAAPPTRLTQSFIRQGARMFANMPYPPTR